MNIICMKSCMHAYTHNYTHYTLSHTHMQCMHACKTLTHSLSLASLLSLPPPLSLAATHTHTYTHTHFPGKRGSVAQKRKDAAAFLLVLLCEWSVVALILSISRVSSAAACLEVISVPIQEHA